MGFLSYLQSFWTRGTRDIFAVFLFYFVIFTVYFMQQLKGALLLPGDSFTQNYPLRLYLSTVNLKDFLWLPYEFLGLPFLGTLQTGLLYPLNFIYLFLPASFVFGFNIVFHQTLASWSSFLYLRQLELDRFPAFMGGLIFGAFGFLMAHKGHTSMINAAVWLPLMLFLYERTRRSLAWKYSAWAAVVVAVQAVAGHYQICVYSYLALGFFTALYFKEVAKDKRLKFILLCTMPIVWGSLIALPQLFATKELSLMGLRVGHSYDFFTEFSFPPIMLPSLIFPFFFGTAYGGSYWGLWNATEMIGYVGILPLVLGIWVTIMLWKKNLHIKFFALLALSAFLLALGRYNPLYRVMYDVPVYNLFRVPARHWLEFDFAIAMLSAFGLQYLLGDSNWHKKLNELLFAFSILGILSLFFVGMGGPLLAHYYPPSLFNQDVQKALDHAFSLSNPAVLVPLGFLCLYLIWVYLLKRTGNQHSWRKTVLLGVGLGVVLAESFSFGGFHEINYVKLSEIRDQLENPLTTFLKNKAGYERTAFINHEPLSLFNVPAGIYTLNGYDPLIPEGVHELLNMSPFGTISDDWVRLLQNNLILSTLNTRYIAVRRQEIYKYRLTENMAATVGSKFLNVPLGQWDLINSVQTGKNEFVLAAPEKDVVSMIHQRIALLPDTTYLLSLEARSKGEKCMAGISIDLFGGPNYDFSEQQLDVDSQELRQEYRTFYKMINTGKSIPPRVELRVFSFSEDPILLRKIEVSEVNGSPRFHIANWNPNAQEHDPMYWEVFDGGGWVVYENLNCLPRAFTVSKIDAASNIKDVKKKFEFFEFDPTETALVGHKDITNMGRTSFDKGEAHIEEYRTDRVVINTQFQKNAGFLILADQYFPGWTASVDGKKTHIYQTNGLLRGVVVPEGAHTVEFLYRPWKIYFAAMIGFFAFMAALFVGFRSSPNRRLTVNKC